MELGDAAEALRAKAELAKGHAEQMKQQAREQRDRAHDQLYAEEQRREAAREALPGDEKSLYCDRCKATWSHEAVREATRRRVACLLCGGPLTPVP